LLLFRSSLQKMPKDQKTEAKGEKAAPRKQFPLTEEEKAAQAKVDKCEKQIEELSARVKEIKSKLAEKENARIKLRQAILQNRNAIKKITEQIEEKRKAQNEAFGRAQKFIDSLRNRKSRRSDERAELMKLLPKDAHLPPLREEEDGPAGTVSDYDRAIKIVDAEIERIQMAHATGENSVQEEKRVIGSIARWNSVKDKIKELEAKAAAPLAELAEVDVMSLLETCRKLKGEIQELQKSYLPHYAAIEEAVKKTEENRADVPNLLENRAAIVAQIKEAVARLHDAEFELDTARFKAQHARNEKRRAEAQQKSEAIKARNAEFDKKREDRIAKAMNTLPHEREVAVANQLLSLLRSVALPGTCGIPESAAPAAPKAKAGPTMKSAPSLELEESAPNATQMVVSRKTQPVPKVGKKQNKKKAAAAAAAEETKKQEPKKKTKEDLVRVSPVAAGFCDELSLKVPTTYGEVEETYNAAKEKLEGFEKVRNMIKEKREKDLQEAEKKAIEDAAKKEEEKAKAKAEAAEKAAEEPAAEAEKPAEEPAAEAEKPAEEPAEEPAAAAAE